MIVVKTNQIAVPGINTGESLLIVAGNSSGFGGAGNIDIRPGAPPNFGFSPGGSLNLWAGVGPGFGGFPGNVNIFTANDMSNGWTFGGSDFFPITDDVASFGVQGGAKPKYGWFSSFLLVGKGNDNIGGDEHRFMGIGSDNDLGSAVTKMTIVHMSQTAANGGGFNVYRLRGTDMGAPTPVLNGDVLGTFSASGNIGNPGYNIKAGAGIRITASQDWSSGHCGSEMFFSVNLNDSMDSPFDVFALRKTGDLELLNGAFLLAGGYHIEPYEIDAGNSGTAITLDLSAASSQKLTLDNNATITLSNATPGGTYTLRIAQDATGGRTMTWPANVIWPGGVTPSFSTSANRVDLVTLYLDGTSTNFYASAAIGYQL